MEGSRLRLSSYSPIASEPTNTAWGKSCAILRRLFVVGSANRLLRRASVLARGDPRVAPEPARLPYFLFQYRQMEDDMITISTAQFGLRLLLAIGMGAMVGLERQWRQRMAGTRTNAPGGRRGCSFCNVRPIAQR